MKSGFCRIVEAAQFLSPNAWNFSRSVTHRV